MRQFSYVYDEEKLEKEVFNDPRCYDNANVIQELKQEYTEREWEDFVKKVEREMEALGFYVDLEEVLEKLRIYDRRDVAVFVFDDIQHLSLMFNHKEHLEFYNHPENNRVRIDYSLWVPYGTQSSNKETKEQKQAIKA